MAVGNTKAQRSVEIREAEASNAVFGIGRDIGRVDGPDRDRHPQAAGERGPAGHSMARCAIAEFGEVFTARDQRRCGFSGNEIFLTRGAIGEVRDSHQTKQAAKSGETGKRDDELPSHAGTSGPGDLRYVSRTFAAEKYASPARRPVGL